MVTEHEVPSVLFLASFPPRECGIATFTKDVVNSCDRAFRTTSYIIAVDEPGGEFRRYPSRVIGRFSQNDYESYARIANFIAAQPEAILNVQHEFGLFGGVNGEWLIEIIRNCGKPVVVTLHTVLPEPDAEMLRVTRALCEVADGVVSLSNTGRRLLIDVYGVDPNCVHVIHHGVPTVPFMPTEPAKASFGIGQRTVISTFGLINRGKGLEYAIEAMQPVVERHPEALYLILGETHPVVRSQEGESYRESLIDRIGVLGLRQNVKLVDKYLDDEELLAYLAATDIYLTPYLNPVQIASGTLAYAVGCGKAVVSTPYLYAQELLANQRGFLCEFRDSESIASHLIALLDDPALRRCVERRAYRFGRQMTWPNVASEYGRVFASVVPRDEPALEVRA